MIPGIGLEIRVNFLSGVVVDYLGQDTVLGESPAGQQHVVMPLWDMTHHGGI